MKESDAAGAGISGAEAGLDADQLDYMADMILELQRMASKAGQHGLAQKLLAAYEAAARRP